MHAIIVGGGIGGLCAALNLAQAGVDVTVFEQAPAIGEAGAGIQLSPNATRVLWSLGLEAPLSAVAFRPEATEMRGWKNGQLISRTPLGDAARSRYGFPYLHIHRGDLIGVLETAVRAAPRIQLRTGARVESVGGDAAGVEVRGSFGELSGDVLIGADGIRSVVRTHLFGAEQPVFTGNVAWRLLIPAAELPEGLVRPVTTAWWGPGAHFVHYYVRAGELVNCVCVVEQAGWTIESWTEPGDPAELQAAFARWHPQIRTLTSRARRDTLFKWALFDRPPMPTWSVGRMTLLGDACHPTLPFMAQGAAMAIEDGAVLTACLAYTDDAPAALKAYEGLRLKRTAGIQTGSRRNATIFHLRGIKAWFRDRAAGRAAAGRMDGIYSYDALNAVHTTRSQPHPGRGSIGQ